MARYFLDLRAPANDYKSPNNLSRPITHACRNGFAEIVRLLLDHESDVNEGSPSPIVCIIEFKYKIIVYLLRERGAILDISKTDNKTVRRAKITGFKLILILLTRER